MAGLTLLFAELRFPAPNARRAKGCVMILVRFAISIFALALLGMALSLSAAQSRQASPAPAAVTLR